MTIWDILEIEETTDKRAIKRAYAKLAAIYHPEDQPIEFQRIYAAYQEALEYADKDKNAFTPDISLYEPQNLSKDTYKGYKKTFKEVPPHDKTEYPQFPDNSDNISWQQQKNDELQRQRSSYNILSEQYDENIYQHIEKGSHTDSQDKEQRVTIDFDKVLNKDTVSRFHLKNESEHNLDTPPILHLPDYPSVNKKPSAIIVFFIIIIVYVMLKLAINWTGNSGSPFDTNEPRETQISNYFEKEYDIKVNVTPINEPSDLTQLYYLVDQNKPANEYSWYQCDIIEGDIAFTFHATYNLKNGIYYDYSYQQLFALIKKAGLEKYIDVNEIQKNNNKYYNNNEQRYCYPVLTVPIDNVGELFYKNLYILTRYIEESDAQYKNTNELTINIKNKTTKQVYKLKLKKGETVTQEYIKQELSTFFGV